MDLLDPVQQLLKTTAINALVSHERSDLETELPAMATLLVRIGYCVAYTEECAGL